MPRRFSNEEVTAILEETKELREWVERNLRGKEVDNSKIDTAFSKLADFDNLIIEKINPLIERVQDISDRLNALDNLVRNNILDLILGELDKDRNVREYLFLKLVSGTKYEQLTNLTIEDLSNVKELKNKNPFGIGFQSFTGISGKYGDDVSVRRDIDDIEETMKRLAQDTYKSNKKAH